MKIVAISDLHGDLPDPQTLPPGEVLIIAGDVLPDDYGLGGLSPVGSSRVMRQGTWFDVHWVPWLKDVKQHFEKILWIGGNHDFFLQMIMAKRIKDSMPEGVHYLIEEELVFKGVKFYGVPWNTTEGWAFCLDEEDHYKRLKDVPPDVDVFICHGPPYTAGFDGELEYFTSPALAHYIREHQSSLKAFICGHVHEAYGVYKMWDVPVYVVSSKDRNYKSVNPPVIIEVPDGDV